MKENNNEWDLKQILDLDNFQTDEILSNLLEKANSIQDLYKNKIDSDEITADTLLPLLEEYESLEEELSNIHDFIFLSLSIDFKNTEILNLKSKFDKINNEIRNKLSFIRIELGNLLSKKRDLIYSEELANYQNYLHNIKLKQPYLLSDSEENIINDLNVSGVNAWSQLQKNWLSSKKFNMEIDGENQDYSFFDALTFMRNPDPIIRRDAMIQTMDEIQRDGEIYASSLRAICNNHSLISKRRGYKNALSPSIQRNEINEDILDNLIAVVIENKDIFQETLKIKAKLMGRTTLQGEDLWAPIPQKNLKEFSWQEANKLVSDSLNDFDEEFLEIANLILNNNLIDAFPRKGKVLGGFCLSNIKNKFPYIFLNYRGTLGDVRTLAHELGHGIHAYYTMNNQTYLNAGFTSVMSEVASEFSNFLLSEKLLRSADEETKREFLFEQLYDLCITIFKVASRLIFEKNLYIAIEQNEYLIPEKISELYLESRKQLFGDAIEFLPGQSYDWCWTSHYFFPCRRFENYPYVTAELFVLSLFRKYKEEGNHTFIPKFKTLLSYGTSKDTISLVKEIFDLNLSNKKFWEIGMREMRSMLEEVKKLYS